MDLILSLDYNLYGAFQVAGVVGHVGFPGFWALMGWICFRVRYLARVLLVSTKVPWMPDSPPGKLTVFWEWELSSSVLYHGSLCCA